MSKEEFLATLKGRLSGLPKEDIDERLGFYCELIDDRMEEGIPEDEAVAMIGDIDAVVEQITSETPLTTLVKEKVRPKRSLKAWEIVLLILGSPVWVPLVLAAIIIILAIYIVIWAAVICIYAVEISLAAGALGGIAGIITHLVSGNFLGAILSLGIGLTSAGLAILLFFGCIFITKYIIKLTKKILVWTKSLFIGREVQNE